MDIQPVGDSKRTLGGVDFFLLWAGVAISLAEIWAGGFLAPLGFWTGCAAIITGHLIGNTFMALGGVIGSDHGIMSMVSVRASFGIRGSNLAAVLNIVQLIGWAAVMLIIGGRAGAMLGRPVGGVAASTSFWTVSIGLGTLLWAHFTGRTLWKLMQRVAVIALLLVIGLMTSVTFGQFGAAAFSVSPRPMPFMFGLDLVIAMPISWMPLVSDYSRFARKTAPAFWNTWWGYFLISSWMYLLGHTATLVTGETDPGVLILTIMGQIGLALPALVMVVLSTITTGFPDVYSATCSTLNISGRFGARTILWAAGLLSICVALVFPMEKYEHFLLFIGAMFVPLFGVVLTDYFLIRRRNLQVEELYKTGGAYWYSGGFNPRAIFAWAAGFVLYEAIAVFKLPVGGSLPALAVAGLVYFLLSRER
jgi:putative hydroxymethylpyrimidine transporter CytX